MSGLRLRLFLVIALVSVVTLAAVGAFTSRVSTQVLEELSFTSAPPQRDDSIRAALQQHYDTLGGLESIESEIQRLAAQKHLEIVLLSPQSSVIAASSPELKRARVERRGGMLHLTWGPKGTALQADPQNDVYIRGGGSSLRDARGKPVASIYVLPPARADLRPPAPAALAARIGGTIWIAIGVGILCALGAALVLSSQILRPVSALTLAARRMAAGDFKARVRLPGDDEIAQLGRSFDSMAENLDRLEQLRVSMVADVAHELRTPLTNIRAHIEALQDHRIEPDAAALDSLAEEARLLERLVEDLQDLSTADAGRLSLRPVAVDLRAAVRTAVEAFAPQAAARRIELRPDLGADQPLVAADAERLRQILHNLLANAVAYTPTGGHVTVSSQTNHANAGVTIFNSGAAIPEEELGQIFERFHRVDKSRSRATGGAGLGLAITRQLVEAHGGKIWAENVNGGVAVCFTLPLKVEKSPR